VRQPPPLLVTEVVTGCNVTRRKCPYCVYLCYEEEERLRQHIVSTHVTFTVLSKTWQSSQAVTVPPPNVIALWRREGSLCTNTINNFDLAIVRIWDDARGYCIHLCPLCGITASLEDEIRAHQLVTHLRFKHMTKEREFSSLPYDSLQK
jgi:hypothetical protein